jgi:hypothetical protein
MEREYKEVNLNFKYSLIKSEKKTKKFWRNKRK